MKYTYSIRYILTRSRCGAGTTSTPLSRSRARFLPSLNPGNDNTVSELPTYLGKPGRGGKSYRNRWQRTDRSPQVTNPFARDCRGSTLSTYIFLALLHRSHRGPHPHLFFC
jgi:hypothetical protein